MGPDRWALDTKDRAVSATAMEKHATLQARISAAWSDLLRRNRGAEGRPGQYYALSVETIRGRGEAFELCLTFRAGRTYCCCEDLCHTGVFTEKRWRQLRALAVHGVEPQGSLMVRICTRLEAGARLHDGKRAEPEPEAYDQVPWTLAVHEQSRSCNSLRVIRATNHLNRYRIADPGRGQRRADVVDLLMARAGGE